MDVISVNIAAHRMFGYRLNPEYVPVGLGMVLV